MPFVGASLSLVFWRDDEHCTLNRTLRLANIIKSRRQCVVVGAKDNTVRRIIVANKLARPISLYSLRKTANSNMAQENTSENKQNSPKTNTIKKLIRKIQPRRIRQPATTQYLDSSPGTSEDKQLGRNRWSVSESRSLVGHEFD